MSRWILFIRGGDYGARSPEEMQQIVQRFSDWAKDLHRRELMTAGDELATSSKLLTRASGTHKVLDGPYVESKEVISGYFVIAAETEDQAIEIAKECPHLDYDGDIEVVQVV